MSYIFIYQYEGRYSRSGLTGKESWFDYDALNQITEKYVGHPGLRYYSRVEHDDAHIIHKIGRAVNDDELLYSFILKVEDDFEAMQFRLAHDNFFKPNGASVKMIGPYINIDFDELLNDCPLVKDYVERGTTRKVDTKYVTKVAGAIYDLGRNIGNLNGALGEDVEQQMREVADLANQRVAEYREHNRKTSATLAKERSKIRKKLAKYLAKD
jgi:hypothetical protein